MGLDFDSPVWSLSKWFQENPDWATLILLFGIAQLINVVLSTVKSILLIKGSKNTATLVNTLSYSISAFITAIIGSVIKNVWITVFVTFVTNAVGVYLGLTIVEKFKKEHTWKISATCKTAVWQNVREDLLKNNIKFMPIDTSWDKRTPFDVYSETKEESNIIRHIFKQYKVKYIITESQYSL